MSNKSKAVAGVLAKMFLAYGVIAVLFALIVHLIKAAGVLP